tara:strand:- start:6 stop:209 length:204 start_codon:yes stop_codon:yes gene_type:complete
MKVNQRCSHCRRFGNQHQLYNISEDISETTDVASEHPDMTAALIEQLDRWLLQTGALIPKPNPAFKN